MDSLDIMFYIYPFSLLIVFIFAFEFGLDILLFGATLMLTVLVMKLEMRMNWRCYAIYHNIMGLKYNKFIDQISGVICVTFSISNWFLLVLFSLHFCFPMIVRLTMIWLSFRIQNFLSQSRETQVLVLSKVTFSC